MATIEGTPKLGWGTSTQTTFVGALAAALVLTEHPVGVGDLMGLTGLAFRTRWLRYDGERAWCPSCPCGECPEEIAMVESATGWRLKGTMEPAGIGQERLAEIVASIDRGVPAIVYDQGWNCAVAYGYEGEGRRWVVSDYSGNDGLVAASELPPLAITVDAFVGPVDPAAAARSALELAVENWHIDHKDNGPAVYWYGRSAFDHWIDDVLHADVDEGCNLPFVSWWNMDVLVDARRLGAEWLGDLAESWPSGADRLRRASGLFAEEHRMLWTAWADEHVFEADPAKWQSDTDRTRMAEVLGRAKDLEARAVAELEAALVASL